MYKRQTYSYTIDSGGNITGSVAEEDKPFALNAEGFDLKAGWANQDADGSERTYALLSPEIWDPKANGFVKAYGATFTWDGGSGTFNGTTVKVPMEKLDTVTFTAPPDVAGAFRIKVQAHTVDTDPDGGTVDKATSGEAWLKNILVKPLADEVTLATTQAKGLEDTPIDLTGKIVPTSQDPNETFRVTLAGIPDGAKIVYDNVERTVTGGSVTIENFDRTKQLSIQPPENSNEDITLRVTAVSVDTITVPKFDASGNPTDQPQTLTHVNPVAKELDLHVDVKGVADAATLVTRTLTVNEGDTDAAGGKIALKDAFQTAALKDADSSETLSLVVSGLKEQFDMTGAEFLDGEGEGRRWLVTQDALNNNTASVVVPKNYSGTLNFTTRAITVENDGATNANAATANVAIQVTPTPEASMNLTASGKEDEPTRLDFSVRHQNGDTDETIQAVWIDAADAAAKGVTLTRGAAGPALVADADGWYKIEGNALNNIYAKGPANLGDAEVRFGVKYTVGDAPADGTLGMETQQFDGDYTLKLAPVTDATKSSVARIAEGAGTMTVNGTTDLTITKVGNAGQATFKVDVKVDQKADPNAGDAADTDGSEKLSYLIVDNVPHGVSIKGGFLVGEGTPRAGEVSALPTDPNTSYPVNRWMVEIPEGESAFSGGTLTRTLEFALDNSGGIFNNSQRRYTMKATAYSKDGTAVELEQSKTSWVLNTDITAAGDSHYIPPTLEASKKDFAATEDQPITLNQLIGVKVLATGNDTAGTYVITLKGLDPRIEVEGMTRTQVSDGQGGMQDAWTASAQGTLNLQNAQDSVDALLQRVTLKLPQDWNANKAPGDALDIKFDADIRGYTVASNTSDNTTYGHADLTDVEPTGVTPVTDPMTMTVAAPGVSEGCLLYTSDAADD